MKRTHNWPSSLTKADRAMFERFRIPPDLVADARITRVTDSEAREKWFLSAAKATNLAGLVFPYPSPENEGEIRTCRVRRDKPDIIKGKEQNKYLSPVGGQRCLYRPPGTRERLNSQDTSIVLVEAEKSALALTAWAERQERSILPLAMGGCWGWSDDKAPMHDLEVCRGRRVYVLLDANAATNPEVQKARTALATALRRMGCDVLIVSMPQIEGVNGPDDLLTQPEGEVLMGELFDTAATAVAAPHSEDALAARFAEQQRDDLRFVKAWGKWLVWEGQKWQRDATDQALSRAAAMLELVAGEECVSDSAANRVRSAKTIREVSKLAGIHDRLAATADQWDGNSWLLNTPDGIVDLHTGKLRPAKRDDYCTKMTAVAPSSTPPKRWLQFLREITKGDKTLQEYLQRVVGYCLTGSTQEEALFFLYGTGKNGKSKFVGAISGLLGDYARIASMDSFVVSYHGPQHPTDLAGLQGFRLVTASETTEGRRWDEAKVKNITGGDRITARFMRQDFFDYTPSFKLLLHGNHKPGLRGTDEAIRRRLHLIPFNAQIPPEKRDNKLAEKLKDEWSGILQWAIEGCLLWQKDGLRCPIAVANATEEYLESQDVLGCWLAEETVPDANSRLAPSELFRDFKGWAEARNEHVGSDKEFYQLMGERGFESKKSHGTRYISGLQLARGAGGVGSPVNRLEQNKTHLSARRVNGASAPHRPPVTSPVPKRKFEGRPLLS